MIIAVYKSAPPCNYRSLDVNGLNIKIESNNIDAGYYTDGSVYTFAGSQNITFNQNTFSGCPRQQEYLLVNGSSTYDTKHVEITNNLFTGTSNGWNFVKAVYPKGYYITNNMRLNNIAASVSIYSGNVQY